jgi:hypothetical protein
MIERGDFVLRRIRINTIAPSMSLLPSTTRILPATGRGKARGSQAWSWLKLFITIQG